MGAINFIKIYFRPLLKFLTRIYVHCTMYSIQDMILRIRAAEISQILNLLNSESSLSGMVQVLVVFFLLTTYY
jgi:hypothetical protein